MFEEDKNKQSSTNNNKGAGLNKPKGEKEASNKNSENQSNSNAYSPSQDNDLQKEIEKAQNIFNKQSKKDKPSSQESSPEKVDKNPEIDKKEPKQEIPSRESSDLRSNKNEPAVEVPEMAKKDIIEKARDAGADNKERVYTMPGKYKDKKPKVSNQGGNKKTLVLVALIIFILAGVGAGYFLWFKPNYQASINQQPPAANEEGDEKDEDEQEQEKEPEEGEEEEGEDKDSQETELSQAKTLDKTVQDNEDKEISTATFDFPKGALPLETQIELSGKYVNDEIRNSEKYSNTSYKIIGALYELSNADIILKKTITLKMGYSESLIQESWEDDLKLAYFKDGMWTPLPGRLDTNKNMIEVEVGVLPSDTFAIVVNKRKLETVPELSQAKTLDKTVQDNEDKEISTATFDFPKGALPLETQIELSGKYVNDEIRNSEKYSNTSYKIIGALYELSNADIILKKTITLKMGYSESLIQESWEDDLKLAYFKDGMWTPLPGRLDTNKNMIEVEVGVLPSDTFAIVVNKDYISSGPEEFSVVPDIVSSTDSDNDGLTDVEEELFATEKNNPDSDGDQNPDGQEVITLKDPTSDESGAKLTTTGLLDVYTNPTFSYSFFYPADWLAKSLPNTNDEEVLVITNTGEFFTITVEDNPELLSPDKWYLNQSSLSDDSELYSTTVNNQPAIWNPNRSTVYIARDNKIYALSYKIGTEAKANFKSTFEMIIKGFQFVTQPQGRPNGTLIKYPDEPGVYLVENGKKRPFKSGEVFTNLGFKWEDVIEIPISEEYPTGEIITGRLDGTLIKYPDEPGVYLVENGKKRPFKSGEVFTNLGFKWEDVIEIPSDENYPTGAVIDSHVTSTPITP